MTKGLSTTAWVVIGLAATAVIGIVGYLVLKPKKDKLADKNDPLVQQANKKGLSVTADQLAQIKALGGGLADLAELIKREKNEKEQRDLAKAAGVPYEMEAMKPKPSVVTVVK